MADSHPSSSQSASEGEEDELIRGSDVIVLHPGSSFLRLGFATDPIPTTIPHRIGRFVQWQGQKRKRGARAGDMGDGSGSSDDDEGEDDGSGSDSDGDLSKPKEEDLVDEVDQLVKERRTQRRRAPATGQAASFNESVAPERIPAHLDDVEVQWLSIADAPERFVIGDELHRVRPSPDLLITSPVRHGHLNITRRWSQQAVKADLRDIWSHAIQKHLKISPSEFKHYRTLVLVPDMCRRRHLRAMIEVLLDDLGFAAVLLHQESVCATFGAGVSSACVVDVGASKVSVSCVDEGISLEQCRVTLAGGGDDVTRMLFHMLENIDFPYKTCNIHDHLDWEIMDKIKRDICSILEEPPGLEEHDFVVRRPGALATRYRFKTADETYKSPLIFFVPWATPRLKRDTEVDPTDTFDDDFIHQASMQVLPTRYLYGQAVRTVAHGAAAAAAAPAPAVAGSTSTAAATPTATAANGEDAPGDSNGPPAAPAEPAEAAVEGFACRWPGCGRTFDDIQGLYAHVMDLHVAKSTDPVFVCRWPDCPRASRPFAHKPSITAHIRTHVPVKGGDLSAATRAGTGGRETPLPLRPDASEDGSSPPPEGVWSIDQAIHYSIKQCGSDELKKRMYNNILLTGGGHRFRGFHFVLEHSVKVTMDPASAALTPAVQVLADPKDLDSRMLCWKGASILARLDQADDYWIEHDEWQERGVGLLRDVMPFAW